MYFITTFFLQKKKKLNLVISVWTFLKVLFPQICFFLFFAHFGVQLRAVLKNLEKCEIQREITFQTV